MVYFILFLSFCSCLLHLHLGVENCLSPFDFLISITIQIFFLSAKKTNKISCVNWKDSSIYVCCIFIYLFERCGVCTDVRGQHHFHVGLGLQTQVGSFAASTFTHPLSPPAQHFSQHCFHRSIFFQCMFRSEETLGYLSVLSSHSVSAGCWTMAGLVVGTLIPRSTLLAQYTPKELLCAFPFASNIFVCLLIFF